MQLSSFALFKIFYDIPTPFLIMCSKHDPRKYFNSSKPSLAFPIETSNSIYTANQMTGSYIKCNSGLKWVNSTWDNWLGLGFFDVVVKIRRTCLISLMDESLYFEHTRNCKQETIYYIQQTKTLFEKFFTLILRRNRNIMVLVISTGKRQIRLSSNVSRANNKWLEQLERFYSGKN